MSTARNGEWIVLGTAMALNALFSVAVVLTATLEVWEVYLVGFIGGISLVLSLVALERGLGLGKRL